MADWEGWRNDIIYQKDRESSKDSKYLEISESTNPLGSYEQGSNGVATSLLTG